MVIRSVLEPERHSTALDDAALADLSRRFRGELIRPGDSQYDAARAVWNGAIDRHPGLVARCTGTGDVQAAIRFARERDLPAYCICHDSTLKLIAKEPPESLEAMEQVKGMGPYKVKMYGQRLLESLRPGLAT